MSVTLERRKNLLRYLAENSPVKTDNKRLAGMMGVAIRTIVRDLAVIKKLNLIEVSSKRCYHPNFSAWVNEREIRLSARAHKTWFGGE